MKCTPKCVGWSIVLAAMAFAAQVNAAIINPVSIADRVRGAERVVVATVADVTATFETNEFGDRLIVSHLTLQVEESLKGRPAVSLPMDLEGGTIGDLTLEVSSLPTLVRGERAVFFLAPAAGGKYVPHLRGQGILKLDAGNRVKGSSLELDTIRQIAAAATAR